MPFLADLIGVAGSHDLIIMVAVTAIAGLVRGFVGFGAGMVFVPVAAAVLGQSAAVGTIWLADAPVTASYALAAMRGSRWREIGPLLIGALAGLPLGMVLLVGLDPTALRWGTSIFILVSVIVLATGWRYRGEPGLIVTFLVGFVSGISTGLVGIGGPFIALFWLGGLGDSLRVKQNLNAYFGLTTITVGPAFWLKGIITLQLLQKAVPLAAVYTLATLVGTFGYSRSGERSYRSAAFLIAAAAALLSLPALDPWLR